MAEKKSIPDDDKSEENKDGNVNDSAEDQEANESEKETDNQYFSDNDLPPDMLGDSNLPIHDVPENPTMTRNRPDIGLGDSILEAGSSEQSKDDSDINNPAEAFPDLYPKPRDNVKRQMQSVGISDMTSVLPDFVQDHLAMEQQYFKASSDMKKLPDLSSFSTNISRGTGPDDDMYSPSTSKHHHSPPKPAVVNDSLFFYNSSKKISGRNKDYVASEESSPENAIGPSCSTSFAGGNRKNRNILPLDLPLSFSRGRKFKSQNLPFDLTQRSKSDSCGFYPENSPRLGIASTLPDFLSDSSHMYSRNRTSDPRLKFMVTEQPMSEPSSYENRLEMLQMENNALRSEVERLRELLAREKFRSEQAEHILAASRTVQRREPDTKPHEHDELEMLRKRLENIQNMPSRSCINRVEGTDNVIDMYELACARNSAELERVTKSTINSISQLLNSVAIMKDVSKDLDSLAKPRPRETDSDGDDEGFAL